MRFQSVAFFSLVGLAAANPMLDISIHAGNAVASKGKSVVAQDICLKVCWPTEPTCPDTWYSSNKGDSNDVCWTCCKAPSVLTTSSHSKAQTGIELVPENAFPNDLATLKQDFSAAQIEHCLLICASEPITCGHPMYQKKFADCNTCCYKNEMFFEGKHDPQTLSNKPTRTDNAPAAPKGKSLNKQDIGAYQICLKVCWPETPTCPDGWYSSNLGSGSFACWSCCKSPSIEDEGLTLQVTGELK